MKDAETNRLMGSLWIDPRQPVLFMNGKSCYAVNWAMVIAKHVMCARGTLPMICRDAYAGCMQVHKCVISHRVGTRRMGEAVSG